MSPLIARWLPLALIVAAWGASLALPGLTAGGRTYDGLEVLLRGWEGISRGVYAWIANPLFAAALVAASVKRDRAALTIAAIAVVIGATSFITDELLLRRMSGVPPIELRIGFYVWLGAMLALCLHALTHVLRERRHRLGPRARG